MSRSAAVYIILATALLLPTACTGQKKYQLSHSPDEATPLEQGSDQEETWESDNFEGIDELEQSQPAHLEFGAAAGDEVAGGGKDVSPRPSLAALDDTQVGVSSASASETEEGDVLVFESIARQDCIVRGLIKNRSDNLYARNVTITLSEKEGDKRSDFHWPLTIEPGESAPFEVSITWFPDRLPDRPVELWGDHELLWFDDLLLEPWANLDRTISADFSRIPDAKRAITFNADETEYEWLYQTMGHDFLIHDDRAYELEDYKRSRDVPEEYSFLNSEAFFSVFPTTLVASRDVESMMSSFSLYKYTDIYYTPDELAKTVDLESYPDVLEDVRVFQAIVDVDGSRVVDLWELIPHSVSEEMDSEGQLIARNFIPVNDLRRYQKEQKDINEVFITLLHPSGDPEIQFPNRDFRGQDATHADNGRTLVSRLWMGGASHEKISSVREDFGASPNNDEISCSVDGGFTKNNRYRCGVALCFYAFPLGFTGKYQKYEPGVPSNEEVIVENDSVLVTGNAIRGLVKNLSDSHIAKKVEIRATSHDGGLIGDVWYWPLSIQPGERAPFEVLIVGDDISVEQINITVSAEFAQTVDLTRAFSLETHNTGHIYGDKFVDLYAPEQFDGVWPGSYLDQNAIWHLPRQYYLKEEFIDMYGNASIVGNLVEADLFRFLDFYARLEVPDSHLDLEHFIRKQYIDNLQVFAAIFDSESKVVSIKQLQPFTPVYGPSNVDMQYVAVNSIPAPNRWSPDAVRILLTIPFADETERDKKYGYQLWIGGAVENTEQFRPN